MSRGNVSKVTPTIPKVLGAHTLHFKPNFKMFTFKILGALRPRLECALASLGQSVACVKIWGASTPFYHACHQARRMEKFRKSTPTIFKVIGDHTLNFKPNFACSPLKFFGYLHRCLRCALAISLGQYIARVKIWGASGPPGQHSTPKGRKSRFERVQTHMSYFLDSGPKFNEFFSPNAEGMCDRSRSHISFQFPILDILTS